MKLTPAQEVLLKDVANGHVWSTNGAAYNGASGRTRRVNAAVQKLRQAGLIEARYGEWKLTDKGREFFAPTKG